MHKAAVANAPDAASKQRARGARDAAPAQRPCSLGVTAPRRNDENDYAQRHRHRGDRSRNQHQWARPDVHRERTVLHILDLGIAIPWRPSDDEQDVRALNENEDKEEDE